jgi:hypothetical protein
MDCRLSGRFWAGTGGGPIPGRATPPKGGLFAAGGEDAVSCGCAAGAGASVRLRPLTSGISLADPLAVGTACGCSGAVSDGGGLITCEADNGKVEPGGLDEIRRNVAGCVVG